jgi:alkanesulfonate monooxygenase SsuD/methylene tetrahydromethanopterin reductase-like flavin-dependent oxidoreductase (luciferase family)
MPDMKFGYFLNAEYPAGTDIAKALAGEREIVRKCAEFGFDSVIVGEHFSHGPSLWLPPIPLLSQLCTEGHDLDFGTAVLVAAMHNPVVLAEQIAYLDRVTGGRFRLGLSAGWNESEFAALGVDRSQRIRELVETVEILRLLWGTDGPVSYAGKLHRFDDVHLTLRPERPGGPPISIGASSEPAVRRVARLADSWVISSHLQADAVLGQARIYEEELTALGRPRPERRTALRNIYVAPTREQALRTAAPFLTMSYQAMSGWGLFEQVLREPTDVDFELASRRAVLGDPDDVASQLIEFIRASGVTEILVRSQWLGMSHADILQSLELFAGEVVPRIRSGLSN